MMRLETLRTVVREFAREDAAGLHAIFGDAETMKNCEPAYDFAKTEAFLRDFCMDKRGALAVEHKETGTLIGYILFNEFDAGVYEMGWIFRRDFWRQGYAYESCRAVLDAAFREKRAHKVFAEAIDNVKSVGLMKKLGMICEGVQRDQTRDNDGNLRDLYFYGILRSEWMQREDNRIAFKHYEEAQPTKDPIQ